MTRCRPVVLARVVGKRGPLILNHIMRNFEVLIISSCQFVTYHCVANQSKYTIHHPNFPEHTRTFSQCTSSHHSGLIQIAHSHILHTAKPNHSKQNRCQAAQCFPMVLALTKIQLVHPSRKIILFGIIFSPAVNESKLMNQVWLFCALLYNQF